MLCGERIFNLKCLLIRHTKSESDFFCYKKSLKLTLNLSFEYTIYVLVMWIHIGYFVVKKLVWNVNIKAFLYTNRGYIRIRNHIFMNRKNRNCKNRNCKNLNYNFRNCKNWNRIFRNLIVFYISERDPILIERSNLINISKLVVKEVITIYIYKWYNDANKSFFLEYELHCHNSHTQ